VSDIDAAKKFFALGAATCAGLLLMQSKSSTRIFPIEALVNPESVSKIASDIEAEGGDFALNAWRYVGSSVGYNYYGSFLHFYDHTVKCQACLLPLQVLSKGYANCVGKSALLASILRNKYSPQEVYMVIGEYRRNGVGGHAWVNIKRSGTWYVAESTSLPNEITPWVSAYDLSDVYVPDAWVNDQGVICYDEEICSFDFKVSNCPCHLDKRVEKL